MKIYDSDFIKQPAALEVQVGPSFPSFLEGAERCRKKILDEYGLPLPPIKISPNANLNPFEIAIFLHGTEIVRGENAELNNNTLCSCLEDVVKYNITNFLNQHIVNELLCKLSDCNPDVVDDVMFFKRFPISRLKAILNWLLAERVAINDMNAIMETIVDYIPQVGPDPMDLLEKIREKLACSFMQRFADENKCVHAIILSPSLSDFLWERLADPTADIEPPRFNLEYKDSERLINIASKKMLEVKSKGFFPVFACPEEIRHAFANLLSGHFGSGACACVSAPECESAKFFLSIINEGEMSLDE